MPIVHAALGPTPCPWHPSSPTASTASDGVRFVYRRQICGKPFTASPRDKRMRFNPPPPRPIIIIIGRLHGHGAGTTGGCRNAVAVLSDGRGISVGVPRLPRFGLCHASSHMSCVTIPYVLVIVYHSVRVRCPSLYFCVQWVSLRCC